MISPQQYRKLMKHYRLNNNISQSATKAGIDRKTAGKYIQGAPSPQEEASPRRWRTQQDAFSEVWSGIEETLFREPRLQAKVLFEQLLEQHPWKFSPRQRRSFERRIRAWKRRHGAEPELFFSQQHRPGERLQLDWMHCD